ncbi:MAG: right-handed parallel beta-helix repeat-containing protein [Planctomycetes bacterium]|nr:right-handed parallel beta-helix repeat-containing protein [Planctomycetota bacterium]
MNRLPLPSVAVAAVVLAGSVWPAEPVPARPAKGQPLRPAAPALPAPDGDVVNVDTAAKLADAVARARAGTTILVADGRYALSKPLHIRADRVSLRGKSGDRTKVILDGGGTLGEAVWLSTCSEVTVADLTIRDVVWNGIKLNSDTGVQKLRVYNCEFRNIWQRAIKAVAVPEANREQLRPRDCRIEYCLFANDRPKKFGDDPDDTAGSFNGNYIAGCDLMYATNWTIANNVFRGISGRTGEGRGAIFLWVDSRDCVIERNVIVDCDAGVSLGNSYRDPKTPVHCAGCVVRNNCVTRAPEGGITSLYTKDCKILHNTICDTTGKVGRGVRVQLDADGLVVANNLLAGPKVVIDTKSRVEERSNREGIAPGVFVDAAAGDLHLAEKVDKVVDAGQLLPDVKRDLDGNRRGDRADLGAHEFSPE